MAWNGKCLCADKNDILVFILFPDLHQNSSHVSTSTIVMTVYALFHFLHDMMS